MKAETQARRRPKWARAVVAMALVCAFVLLGQQRAEAFVAGCRHVARRTARRTTRRVVRRHVAVLPVGYRPVVRAGVTYYFVGGVYYRPVIESGKTVYVVVDL